MSHSCRECLAEAKRRAAVSGRSVIAEYSEVVREPLPPCLNSDLLAMFDATIAGAR